MGIVILSVVAGCEARVNPRPDTPYGVLGDSPARVVDSSAGVTLPVPAPAPASEPTIRASGTDTTALASTPDELSALGAVLDVPVEGVAREQLHDTYAELRGGTRPHEALDIPAPRGTPVLSATDGRVLKLFDSKAGGLMVYATDASEHFILLYGHLDRYADALADGARLERGQVIGFVGTTGNAPPETPHLHFAILRGRPNVAWWSGTPVNPYPLLVPPGR